jgi:hypothetical protein
METGAMLNQFNQFICIQARNVGAIAIGCLIDGLMAVMTVSKARLRNDDWLLRGHHLGQPKGNRSSEAVGVLTPWLQHRRPRLEHEWPMHPCQPLQLQLLR